jgi:replication factor C subunit 3/5
MDDLCIGRYPFTATQAVHTMDWELYVQEIAQEILNEQSPKCLF